jgi:hypothetical protein
MGPAWPYKFCLSQCPYLNCRWRRYYLVDDCVCENCEECKEPCEKQERGPSVYQRLVVASTEAEFEDLSSSKEESPVVDDNDGDKKRVPPETKETVANKDNNGNDDDDNDDEDDDGDNMQTASKGTQTEAGAWINPGC